MARFTVTFKDHIIGNYLFDSGEVTVGRDPKSTVVIDSLAVAPRHAMFVIDRADRSVVVRRLATDCAIWVNNEECTERALSSGDRVNLGKHFIIVDIDSGVMHPDDADDLDLANGDAPSHAARASEGNLQVLNGKYIGRVIPLRKAMTKLGRPEFGVAVIARRREGYFLSPLEAGHRIKVNSVQLVEDQTLKLEDGDTLEIDQHRLQFYLGSAE